MGVVLLMIDCCKKRMKGHDQIEWSQDVGIIVVQACISSRPFCYGRLHALYMTNPLLTDARVMCNNSLNGRDPQSGDSTSVNPEIHIHSSYSFSILFHLSSLLIAIYPGLAAEMIAFKTRSAYELCTIAEQSYDSETEPPCPSPSHIKTVNPPRTSIYQSTMNRHLQSSSRTTPCLSFLL